MIIRTQKISNFSIIDNRFLKDDNLSWQAKGVMSYILSLPDDWKLHWNEIEQHSPGGRTQLKNIRTELIKAGYIRDDGIVKRDGKIVGHQYTVLESPFLA